jgi:hypothetical protein
MDVAERPVINFAINGPSEVVLSEEAIAARQRKLQEAKKHLASINEKILELQVMLRRLSRKPRFHKLQYVLKHRVAVYSGKKKMNKLTSVTMMTINYFKKCRSSICLP